MSYSYFKTSGSKLRRVNKLVLSLSSWTIDRVVLCSYHVMAMNTSDREKRQISNLPWEDSVWFIEFTLDGKKIDT